MGEVSSNLNDLFTAYDKWLKSKAQLEAITKAVTEREAEVQQAFGALQCEASRESDRLIEFAIERLQSIHDVPNVVIDFLVPPLESAFVKIIQERLTEVLKFFGTPASLYKFPTGNSINSWDTDIAGTYCWEIDLHPDGYHVRYISDDDPIHSAFNKVTYMLSLTIGKAGEPHMLTVSYIYRECDRDRVSELQQILQTRTIPITAKEAWLPEKSIAPSKDGHLEESSAACLLQPKHLTWVDLGEYLPMSVNPSIKEDIRLASTDYTTDPRSFWFELQSKMLQDGFKSDVDVLIHATTDALKHAHENSVGVTFGMIHTSEDGTVIARTEDEFERAPENIIISVTPMDTVTVRVYRPGRATPVNLRQVSYGTNGSDPVPAIIENYTVKHQISISPFLHGAFQAVMAFKNLDKTVADLSCSQWEAELRRRYKIHMEALEHKFADLHTFRAEMERPEHRKLYLYGMYDTPRLLWGDEGAYSIATIPELDLPFLIQVVFKGPIMTICLLMRDDPPGNS